MISLIEILARQIDGCPHYTQRMRQYHVDFTIATQSHRDSEPAQMHGSLLSTQEITITGTQDHSPEEYLHSRGIEARHDTPRNSRTSNSPGLGRFVPRHHYLNRRIKALIATPMTKTEIEAGYRLLEASYVFCDRKVTVLVRTCKASPFSRAGSSTNPFMSDSESKGPIYVITKLEKVCLFGESTYRSCQFLIMSIVPSMFRLI